MNTNKSDQPINLTYLKYVKDYMETFAKYLGDNAPNPIDAKLFYYSLRYAQILRTTNDFNKDIREEFNNVINRLNAKIEAVTMEERSDLIKSDVDNDLIRDINFANNAFAAWGLRNNYQYLIR